MLGTKRFETFQNHPSVLQSFINLIQEVGCIKIL